MNNRKSKTFLTGLVLVVFINCASFSKFSAEESSATQQVSELMGWGMYGRALDFINAKIRNNPDSSELYVARGAIYARTKKDSLSIKDQNKALELLEKSPSKDSEMVKANALHNRAGIYARMKKYPDAESDYKRAVTIYPGNSISYLELGKMQLKQKRYSEAKANLSKARELFLKQSGTKDAEEAEKLIEKTEKKS